MRFRVSALLAAAVLGAVTAGCGSSKSSTSHAQKTPSAVAAAQAQIKQSWVKFFSPSTSASAKMSLLQNGKQFAPVINAQATSPLAKESSATVSAVKLTSPTTATVTYTVSLAGTAALKNQTGAAVKTGGTWQVADASFCQLLKLEGSAPPACPKG